MTNKNLTEMVFVLDRSGSMSGLEGDTIGGYNSLLEKQRKEFYKVYHTALDKSFVARQIDALTKAIEVLKTKI